MVIGKRAEGLDARACATTVVTEDLNNFNFWDPQDGKTYGDSVPVSEIENSLLGDVATKEALDITKLSDGIYTGTGKSDSSEYTVEAEIKDGKIVSVKITEGLDKMFGGEEKINEFIANIISAQSIEIDAVSGATQDCNGISAALKSAFTK